MIEIRNYEGITTFKLKTDKEAERFYKMAIGLKCDCRRAGKYVHVTN